MTIAWPSNIRPGSADFGIEFDVQIVIPRSGRIATYGLPGARWTGTITFDDDHEEEQRPRVEALVTSLRGGARLLSMPHFGRPVPRGSLRGSPVLGSAVARGANSVHIVDCNGGLQAGDIISIAGQWLMVEADHIPAGGEMIVPISPAARAASPSGTAVAWDRPHATWIMRTAQAGPFPYMPGKYRPGFSIQLVEAW